VVAAACSSKQACPEERQRRRKPAAVGKQPAAITTSGRKHLSDALSDYDRAALAIARVLGRA
jgi:hypothetical protein